MNSNSNPHQTDLSVEQELLKSEDSVDSAEPPEELAPTLNAEPDPSMQEYYQLQQQLLQVTVALSVIISGSVWVAYSLPIALSYVLGACTGVVYLKMLSKNVAQLGRQRQKLGTGRLAIFIGLIVAASQWQDIQILPAFLGFLTYKAAIIVYTLRVAVLPD